MCACVCVILFARNIWRKPRRISILLFCSDDNNDSAMLPLPSPNHMNSVWHIHIHTHNSPETLFKYLSKIWAEFFSIPSFQSVYTAGNIRPIVLDCVKTKYACADLMRLGLVVSFYRWIIHILLNPNNIIVIIVALFLHMSTVHRIAILPNHTVTTCSIHQPSVNLLYLPYSIEFYEIDRHHLQKTTSSALHFRGRCSQQARYLGEFRSFQRTGRLRYELFAMQSCSISNHISLWVDWAFWFTFNRRDSQKIRKLAGDLSHSIIIINNSEHVQQTALRMRLCMNNFWD